jgi:hypothetical protein
LKKNERHQKELALLAIQERRRRRRLAPLKYFTPHVGQARMHEAMKRVRGVIGKPGNRWGKSTYSGACATCHCYGYWIWEVPDLKMTPEGDYPPRDTIHPDYWITRPDGIPIAVPNQGLVMSGLSMQRGIGAIMAPAIDQFLPPYVLQNRTVHKAAGGVPLEMKLPNGSQIYFGSGHQEPMNYEGVIYHWVGCDEPPPRAHWGAVWRGMTDFFAPFWFTMTPIGPNAPFVFEEFAKGNRDDVEIIHGSIWENPHLSHAAKTAFLTQGGYTDDELNARESGDWCFLSHRAFPTFDVGAHVLTPPRQPHPGWFKLLACDPAHRRPYAFMWIAFGPNGEVHVYNEWPKGQDHARMRSSELGIHDYATIIRNIEGRMPVDFRVLDPRFGKAHFSSKGVTETSIQEDFEKFGLDFTCDVPDIGREETGIERIRGLLRWDKMQPLGGLNVPRLQVNADCTNTINSLALSNFVPPNAKDNLILPEKLQELYKDFRDCLRYGVLVWRPYLGPPLNTGTENEDILLSNDPFSG